MQTLTTGQATPALMHMVNERANALSGQRVALRSDQRRLLWQLKSLEQKPEAQALRQVLADFTALMEEAEPQELQRLLNLRVRRVIWDSNGRRSIQLYDLLPGKGEGRLKAASIPNKKSRTRRHPQMKTGSTFLCILAPRTGFEPVTLRLTVGCSTVELSRNKRPSKY